jgi:hypothetical protein
MWAVSTVSWQHVRPVPEGWCWRSTAGPRRAAQLTVERLAVRGLATRIVSERLNRRKIDLIPEPGREDSPKPRSDERRWSANSTPLAAPLAPCT